MPNNKQLAHMLNNMLCIFYSAELELSNWTSYVKQIHAGYDTSIPAIGYTYVDHLTAVKSYAKKDL